MATDAHVTGTETTTEKLDAALHCLRRYGEKAGVDVSDLEAEIAALKARTARTGAEATPAAREAAAA
jgi:hypothetical protein